MEIQARAPSSVPAVWLRILLAPVTALLVLAGIWIAGGRITDDFGVSMALTGLWFGVVVAGAVVTWRRAPALRLPVSAVAVATFVVVGGALALLSMRDVTVNETVVAGPALAEGAFTSLAHSTEGTARIVEDGGSRILTLTDFHTDPGPDLYVYVVPRAGAADVEGGMRIDRLKGNIGNQQYALPEEVDVAAGATVLIWCRAFSVAFGAATLAPSEL
jgi:Electron transfer DM13